MGATSRACEVAVRRFWRRMAQGWPIAAPHPLIEESLGADVLDVLSRHGLLVRQPLLDGAPIVDLACSSGRVLVVADGDAVAMCTGTPACCEPVELDAPERLLVDPIAFAALLRELLGLDGPTERPHWNHVALLGERLLGAERVRFAFVPRPGCVTPTRLERWLAAHPCGLTVLLAPVRDAIPPTSPPTTMWLSLDETVDLVAGTADLSELAVHHDLAGDHLELLTPRHALVIGAEPEEVLYGGRRLAIERRPLQRTLLCILAERPSEWVCRRELLVALYADEITSSGRYLTDPTNLERRMRQLISDLRHSFQDVGAPDLPPHPIENQRSRSDVEGGYRLALRPEQVWMR